MNPEVKLLMIFKANSFPEKFVSVSLRVCHNERAELKSGVERIRISDHTYNQ